MAKKTKKKTAKKQTKKKTAKKKTSKKAKKKTAKKKTAKKNAAKKAKTKRGPKRSSWTHTSPAAIKAFIAEHGLSEKAAATALGVSVGSIRGWTGKTEAKGTARLGKQLSVKKAMAAYQGTTPAKTTPTASAPSSSPKKIAGTGNRPPEGVSLLAMGIVEQDWNLVKQAYLLLK